MSDTLGVDEAQAIRTLAAAARAFAQYKPRRNVSLAYERALNDLLQAARVFAVKSDEEWAQEVIDAREGKP